MIRSYLKSGLVDELDLAIAPVFLGGGVPLFDRMDPDALGLELTSTWGTPLASHVHYRVRPTPVRTAPTV